MSKNGSIILIDDDLDDQEITKQVIVEIGMKNEIICFSTCSDALTYLLNDTSIVPPFIILSDVNIPLMSGIELKEKIDENPTLRKKSIPFVFYSTSADKQTVDKAYQYRVQGYFVKDSTVNAMKENLLLIFNYWLKCKHPNN